MPKTHNPNALADIERKLEAEAARRGMTMRELAREMSKSPPDPLVHVKMPPALKDKLEAEAERQGKTVQHVIRELLDRGLSGPRTVHVRNAQG